MKTLRLLSCAFLLTLPWANALAQGTTAFTYQGRLTDTGAPASGSYDLRFTLYAALTGPGQVGAAVTNPATAVSNGLFTVSLDFGVGIFAGGARWLEIAVRTNGVGTYATLAPRQPLTPSPYAIYAPNAGTAATANGVVAGSVGTAGLAVGAVDSSRIADGTIGIADLSPTVLSNTFWRLGGNAGTAPGSQFLGTTDNQALELRVGGTRALRIEPQAGDLPNWLGGATNNAIAARSATILGGQWNSIQANANDSFIGGGWQNAIQSNAMYSFIGEGYNNSIQINAQGAVIAGGMHNVIKPDAQLAVVGGGYVNTNGAPYAVIPGGYYNAALGTNSFAAGRRAKANHDGTFVWADYQNADFPSTATNQFLIRAAGGVGINTNNPSGAALNVKGTVTASSFVGVGTGLTGLSGGSLMPGSVTGAALAPGAVSQLGAPDGWPTNALVVNSNGSVGIGTGTNIALAGLHISGGATAYRPNVLFQVFNGTNGYDHLYEPRRLAITSNLVAVASPPEGAVTLIDVSIPSAPVVRSAMVDDIGAFTALAGAAGLAFKGNLLAVAAEGDNAITLISVTNPAAPVKLSELRDGVGAYADLQGVRDVAFASGNILAAAAFVDSAVTLIDVSNSAAPVLRGVIKNGVNNFTNFEGTWHVAARGSLLAIAPDFYDVVTLADISNLAAPVKVGEIRDDVNGFNFLRNPKGLAFSGNLLAIGSAGEHAVTLADVSNPASPQLRAVIRNQDNGAYVAGWTMLAFSGNSLAVAADGVAVNLFDVSNPTMPVVKGVFQSGLSGLVCGVGNDVVLAGTNLVGIGQSGLSIIQPAPVTVGVAAQDYVGIGTVVPLAPLHVVGNVIVERADKVDVRANQISLGMNASATGYGASAMGDSATASGNTAVALGYHTEASGHHSFAAGAWAKSSGDNAVAIGAGVTASGYAATALGMSADASHYVSFVWSDGSAGHFGSSADGQFLVRAGGGVGINKNDPATALDVNGTITATGINVNGTLTATNVVGSFRLNDADAYLRSGSDVFQGLGWYGPGKTFAGQAPDGPVLYGWSGGILGTKSGGAKPVVTWGVSSVDINGSLGAVSTVIADSTSANNGSLQPGLVFGGQGSGEGIASKRTSGGNQFGLDLYTGYAPRLSVTGGGNVGIGTTSPTDLLDVEGDVRINDRDLLLRISTDRNHGLGWYGAGKLFAGVNVNGPALYGNGGGALGTVNSGASTNVALYWNSSGNVGLGTTTPSQKLHVVGNIYATGTITPNSDRNLKTDFAPVDTAAVLEKVTSLPIHQWRFQAEDAAVKHVGPMAQDFRAAFGLGEVPTAIATVDADGVALAAIQGLNQKLEAKNAALEREVAELKALVKALADKVNGGGQ